MPRFTTQAEIVAILQSGNFLQLFGCLEDDHLECKSAPYNLLLDRDKLEFAKDVSALANADGGIILIGLQTEQEPETQGEVIRRVGCFAQNAIDFGQYQNVLSDWVLPSIPGLKFEWYPNANNRSEGIASILVPQEAARERPYVVSKVVEETGRIIGSYVGYFERIRDNVMPLKPSELRARLKDGRRFVELDARLGNIEEMVGKLTVQKPKPPAFTVDVVFKRVQRARREIGYENKPALSLAAWPVQPVEFADLFESHEAATVQLLERPPVLRTAGFDWSTQARSLIVEGQLRRCLVQGRKVLEVWRDGPLIGVLPGDDYLCWGMMSTAESGLRLNNLTLAETVYLFCDWALKMYGYAVPPPEQFAVRLMLSEMTVNGKPCTLNPYRPDPYRIWIDENRRPAPGNQPGAHFEIQVQRTSADPRNMAYRLLSDVYAWFGFDANEMPYVNREEPQRIDPAQIASRG